MFATPRRYAACSLLRRRPQEGRSLTVTRDWPDVSHRGGKLSQPEASSSLIFAHLRDAPTLCCDFAAPETSPREFWPRESVGEDSSPTLSWPQFLASCERLGRFLHRRSRGPDLYLIRSAQLNSAHLSSAHFTSNQITSHHLTSDRLT